MGREFIELFEDWAQTYDSTVDGKDIQYKEVFDQYEQILNKVAEKAGQYVLEFGVGTGNLTNTLLKANKQVIGVEPSKMMRQKAIEKLGKKVPVHDGDFLSFPPLGVNIDTIVSSYAFHHLTNEEKRKAIQLYNNILPSGGKIVFADTTFVDQSAFDQTIAKAKENQFYDLARDLETEYYTTHEVLKEIFTENGFTVTFEQVNEFVWVIEAIKQT
ncbi:class I SAM-dependent methyltransferase [Bacillus carboniphilus]|uniref:Uncharacterized methyltransferase LC087_07950 n=1 Tax=Bacillus carboniphilus TaxID=86663 RepID=A0ABY9JZY2_9BACI|nr:class I SAM-dependent methyltransferase [Bacillus carboniphilus]WLR44023.1 class I SAM-dependent methyltransferase [Bacillus carboniphilus]